MKIEENEIYTTKEVADLLKVSLPTVKRMLKDRRLPSTRIGKQHRFLGRDLLNIMETRQDLRLPGAADAPVAPAAVEIAQPIIIAGGPDPEYVKSLTAIERRQRAYMIGKPVLKAVMAEDGTVLIQRGKIVDDDTVCLARSRRKMMDLFTSLEHED